MLGTQGREAVFYASPGQLRPAWFKEGAIPDLVLGNRKRREKGGWACTTGQQHNTSALKAKPQICGCGHGSSPLLVQPMAVIPGPLRSGAKPFYMLLMRQVETVSLTLPTSREEVAAGSCRSRALLPWPIWKGHLLVPSSQGQNHIRQLSQKKP